MVNTGNNRHRSRGVETEPTGENEFSLDPPPEEWQAYEALGHRIVGEMLNHLRTIGGAPAWQRMPESTRTRLRSEVLPEAGVGADAVYEEFKQDLLPHMLGNIHPRFWGWVCGTGTVGGVLSAILEATANTNVFGADQSANEIELQLLRSFKEWFGFPADASGVFISGGSTATLLGLTVARDSADPTIKTKGLQGKRLRFYGSTETHFCSQKALEFLGLGSDALHHIPVNPAFEIDVDRLRAAIKEDVAAGFHPCCVIGNAGTVNTGAFDDLRALRQVADEYRMWFHVDGAFGAWNAISPRLQFLTAGMESADSLGFDLHKWMSAPYGAACILIRDAELHRRTFAHSAPYVKPGGGLAASSIWFSQYSFELSRPFRALKVWFSLKEHGLAKFRALIEQNVEQCHYLAELVAAEDELELLAPVKSNVVCFRYQPGNLRDQELNGLNQRILEALQESGAAVPSSTILQGRYALRVAHVNHRTRNSDLEFLVQDTLRRGREFAASSGS